MLRSLDPGGTYTGGGCGIGDDSFVRNQRAQDFALKAESCMAVFVGTGGMAADATVVNIPKNDAKRRVRKAAPQRSRFLTCGTNQPEIL